LGPREGAVDDTLREIELAPRLEIAGEGPEHFLHGAALDPELESAMTGLIRGIASWQVLPGGPGPQHPENPVHDIARIPPRAAAPVAPVAPDPGLREQGGERGPLGIGEIHPVASQQEDARNLA
jgi:hypothetical protein